MCSSRAAAGAPEGNPSDLPALPTFATGWRIGQPDAIFAMQEDYAVPAKGTIEHEHFYIPTNFTEEKWLQAIEARPGNRKLVHHVLVFYETPADGPRPTPVLQPNREDSRITRHSLLRATVRAANGWCHRLLATYAPGTIRRSSRWEARFVFRRGVLHLQLHYTANGTAGTDRTTVGMILRRSRPSRRCACRNSSTGDSQSRPALRITRSAPT